MDQQLDRDLRIPLHASPTSESTFNSVFALGNGNPVAKPFTFQDQILWRVSA